METNSTVFKNECSFWVTPKCKNCSYFHFENSNVLCLDYILRRSHFGEQMPKEDTPACSYWRKKKIDMVTIDYVCVEVAKLLETCGLNEAADLSERCDYGWYGFGGSRWIRSKIDKPPYEYDEFMHCPSIWLADEIIQKMFGLYLVAFHTDNGWWGNISFLKDSSLYHKLEGPYYSRDELYNEYIKYCLENN